jgi:hypothetical protein
VLLIRVQIIPGNIVHRAPRLRLRIPARDDRTGKVKDLLKLSRGA